MDCLSIHNPLLAQTNLTYAVKLFEKEGFSPTSEDKSRAIASYFHLARILYKQRKEKEKEKIDKANKDLEKLDAKQKSYIKKGLELNKEHEGLKRLNSLIEIQD